MFKVELPIKILSANPVIITEKMLTEMEVILSKYFDMFLEDPDIPKSVKESMSLIRLGNEFIISFGVPEWLEKGLETGTLPYTCKILRYRGGMYRPKRRGKYYVEKFLSLYKNSMLEEIKNSIIGIVMQEVF